jgi:intraflagellar transport protein 172
LCFVTAGPLPLVLAHCPRRQELNQRGSHVLFRDKSRRLHLCDVARQAVVPLLGFCTYAQWVPGSDCVVAQSRGDLCVWYSVDSLER